MKILCAQYADHPSCFQLRPSAITFSVFRAFKAVSSFPISVPCVEPPLPINKAMEYIESNQLKQSSKCNEISMLVRSGRKMTNTKIG